MKVNQVVFSLQAKRLAQYNNNTAFDY